MTDEQALLASILAAPGDDLPRLVYADWLDENDRPAGKRCVNGNRLTKDHLWDGLVCLACGLNRYAERAEFIRVQCELAKFRVFSDVGGGAGLAALRKRERELFLAGFRGWLNGWNVVGDYHAEATALVNLGSGPDPSAFRFRRGFIEEVRAPLAALFGGPCERCGIWLDRGMPADTHCPDCSGTGTTPGAAAGLWANQPTITRAVLTDREPADRTEVNGMWYWFRNGRNALGHWSDENHLPDELFDLLDGLHPLVSADTIGLPYPTRRAALDALSAAACALGRKRARAATAPAAT